MPPELKPYLTPADWDSTLVMGPRAHEPSATHVNLSQQ